MSTLNTPRPSRSRSPLNNSLRPQSTAHLLALRTDVEEDILQRGNHRLHSTSFLLNRYIVSYFTAKKDSIKKHLL
jgi:hypothetical protein